MLVFKARPRKNPTADPQLTSSERRIMRILGDAMNKVRDQVVRNEGQILDAVTHLSANRVAQMLPVDPWFDAAEKIRDELFNELVAAGQRVKLPAMEKATVQFRFDAERPEAARWAEKEAGNLIRGVVQEQVTVVRDYVSRASMGEFTSRQVARGLRDVIGLTSQQTQWVENFRNKRIEELMLQGRTFDQAYEQSERATNRYHDRVHRRRTETIARTEILRAANEGRNAAWQQGVDEGWINAGNWDKRWSTELDGRQCDVCGPLDEMTVGFNDEFPEGDPPIHPNCRCDVLLVPKPIDDDIAAMTDEEVDAYIDELIGNPDVTVSEPPDVEISEAGVKAFSDAGYDVDDIRERFDAAERGEGAYVNMYEQQVDLWEDFVREQDERDPLDAVNAWGSGDYKEINAALSGEGSLSAELRQSGMSVNTFLEKMDTAFDYADSMREDIVVERVTGSYFENVSQLINSEPGSLFESPQYMATTMQSLDDLRVSGFGGDVQMEILIPKGERALNIDAVSFSGTREFEVLLDRDSQFLLLDKPSRDEDGRWKVRLVKVSGY